MYRSLIIVLIFISISVNAQPVPSGNVPTTFEESNEYIWDQYENYITYSQHKSYVINWKGNGGLTRMAQIFVESVLEARRQGKEVIFRLVGNSASAHGWPICYATKVINKTGKSILFHLGTTKPERLRPYYEKCIRAGILTREQAERVLINGETIIVKLK